MIKPVKKLVNDFTTKYFCILNEKRLKCSNFFALFLNITLNFVWKDFDSASINATPITTSKNFDKNVPILPIIFVVKPKKELKFNTPIILALSIWIPKSWA